MGVDEQRLRRLLEIVGELEFSTLSIEVDGTRVEIRQGDAAGGPDTAGVEVAPGTAARSVSTVAAAAGSENGSGPETTAVEAPLIGTFYRAPKPGDAPYTEVGERVEPDTVVGIIEVMKMMNSVTAGVSGVVVEVCAANGAVVEAGEPLLLVAPGDEES